MRRAHLSELLDPERSSDLQQAQREAWRADRMDDLYQDPAQIAEWLFDVEDTDTFKSLVCAVFMPGDPGMTPTDRTITRQGRCEDVLNAAVQKMLDFEESKGRWEDYGI